MIGCIAVAQPVFFPPDEWVEVPKNWSRNIVSGRAYDLTLGEGLLLWQTCLERAARTQLAAEWTTEAIELRRHGKPQLMHPRLGRASFRLAVLDAYDGACAVTTEHSLPAVDAAHIRPWKDGGRHEIPNGIPLRRDIHRLFDLGFVTVRCQISGSPSARHCATTTPTGASTTRRRAPASEHRPTSAPPRRGSSSHGTETSCSGPRSRTFTRSRVGSDRHAGGVSPPTARKPPNRSRFRSVQSVCGQLPSTTSLGEQGAWQGVCTV